MEYFKVTVKHDCKDKRGKPALSKKLEQEIEDWIGEVFEHFEGWFSWKYDDFLIYAFTDETTATAFKLRWS